MIRYCRKHGEHDYWRRSGKQNQLHCVKCKMERQRLKRYRRNHATLLRESVELANRYAELYHTENLIMGIPHFRARYRREQKLVVQKAYTRRQVFDMLADCWRTALGTKVKFTDYLATIK